MTRHGWFDDLVNDVRYAVRLLLKHKGFTAVAIGTLALGIGANIAVFTVVNSVLIRPLPFFEPDRLVRVFDDLPGAGASDVGLSVPELDDLRDRSGVFDQISAIFPASSALSGGERAERVELLATSPNYFELLGAAPQLGRVYRQSEWQPGFLEGAVISNGLWKRQFGGDPQVIGRRIRVDEDAYTIVGVMPAEFRHPGQTLNGDVDLWAAAGFTAAPFSSPPIRAQRVLPGALGRLKHGITVEQAQQRLTALAARLQESYPDAYPAQFRWSLRVEPASASLTGHVRSTLVLLFVAVTFVLLMVCANLATLLLVRGSGRGHELAIRYAIGAGRARLIRQLLTESIVLSLAGGAAAVAALAVARSSLIAMMPADLPRLGEVRADWRIITIALLQSVVTGVVFGMTPALHASAADPNRDLKAGGRSGASQTVGRNRARSALVVVEVALSMVLLTGAGLLIRSFAAVLHQTPGIDANGLTVAQIWLPVPNNPATNRYLRVPQRSELAREVLRETSQLPGLSGVAVGLANDVPFLSGVRNPRPFSFADDAAARQGDHAAAFGAVSPGYFDVLRTPLKRGRTFTDHDAETAPRVVVVNEAFVRTFSPLRDPIGRRIRAGAAGEFDIVGIVADIRDDGLDTPPPPRVYASIFQFSGPSLAVFVRTQSDVVAVKDALTRTIHRLDAELPVFGVQTMDQLMAASMARRRFALSVMSVFAAVALLLAALGVYGVMAFVVGQRVEEFAIRVVLGARPSAIFGIAFRPGLALTSAGIAVGLVASAALMRFMSTLLFGVSAIDPATFAGAAAALAAVALLACFVPARRATRVSPAQAMRAG